MFPAPAVHFNGMQSCRVDAHPHDMPSFTPMNYQSLADKSLSGETLTQDEAHAVLDTPADTLDELLGATLRVRERHFGRRVKVCVLLNAQSGICPEDCH